MNGKARRRRGPLCVICAMLVASAALRLGEGAGWALALEASPPESAGQNGVALGTSELLAAIADREERLKQRESAFEDRMQALKVAEEQARIRLNELTAAEEALSATIARTATASEDDLNRLTTVYQAMKPKDAALLFEEMDPSFGAGFLARMRPEAAAAIMAGLTPRAAYSFSVLLAGRNAAAPKN